MNTPRSHEVTQFPASTGAGEAELQQRTGNLCRQSGTAKQDALAIRESRSRSGRAAGVPGGPPSIAGRPRVLAYFQSPDDAALHSTLLLHGAEQAGQSAERLLDHPATGEPPHSPAAFDHRFGCAPPDRFTGRAIADAVLAGEFFIAGQARAKIALGASLRRRSPRT